MAFYHNMPEQKYREKREKRNSGWEEEGTGYRGSREERNASGGSRSGNSGGRTRKYTDDRPDRGERGNASYSRERSYGAGRNERAEGRFSDRGYSSGKRRTDSGSARYERDDSFRTERPARARTPERALGDRENKTGRSFQEYEYKAPVQRPAENGMADLPSEEYILTGRNPIREALKNDRDLEKLLVQKGELSGSAREIVAIAKEKKIMVQVVEKSRLDEIAPHHQGLIAIASAYQYAEMADLYEEARERGEDPFFILLDGITDPHNLGAIIRTAECAGAHGVIVPQHRSVGLTPAAVKASAGAVEHVKVARVTNINRTIEEMQKRGIWVYGLSMDGEDYEDIDFRGGIALVIGAEGDGISRLTADKCDQMVSLPMRGKIDSLNASVAAGIMMYKVLSGRRNKSNR